MGRPESVGRRKVHEMDGELEVEEGEEGDEWEYNFLPVLSNSPCGCHTVDTSRLIRIVR